METVPISKFKATCLALLERVRRTGKPLIVTKRGVPVAQIVPPPAMPPRKGSFGAMKGTSWEIGDVLSPVMGEEEWESAR